MRTILPAAYVFLAMGCLVDGAEVQGLVVNRDCGEDIVKHGRQIILKHSRDCSLRKDYRRDGYGIVTNDQKFYRFDDVGNKKARELLKNIPDKDNLKVIISGAIEGDTIKVDRMSLL
ncbi:MAG: hypothetical protein ACJ74Z_03980 [Bryobacteraceae bacterium]